MELSPNRRVSLPSTRHALAGVCRIDSRKVGEFERYTVRVPEPLNIRPTAVNRKPIQDL